MLLRERHAGRQHIVRRLFRAHDFQQLHDVGRTEEVQTDDILRSLRRCRDRVDVLVGGVRCEDRARLTRLIEAREDRLLELGILEYRFDDEIGIGQRRIVGRARK